MKLTCPSCGAVIPAADLNVDTGIAKCHLCNEVFNIFNQLGLPTPTSAAPASAAVSEELVPRPPRMIVEDLGPNAWTAHWRWFDPSYILLTFFCIAWDAFLIFWYTMAFTQHGPWLMIIFPICHVAVGVGLTYTVIAGYLNRTRVTLDGSNLSIRHGPIPWMGNRTLPIDTLQQLYCKRGSTNKNGKSSYELWTSFIAGGEVRLLSLPALGEAKFLEQQIEQKLAITPQPVAGECLHD